MVERNYDGRIENAAVYSIRVKDSKNVRIFEITPHGPSRVTEYDEKGNQTYIRTTNFGCEKEEGHEEFMRTLMAQFRDELQLEATLGPGWRDSFPRSLG